MNFNFDSRQNFCRLLSSLVFSLWGNRGWGTAIPHPFEGVELLSLHRKSPAPGCKPTCEGSAAACAQPLPPKKPKSRTIHFNFNTKCSTTARSAISHSPRRRQMPLSSYVRLHCSRINLCQSKLSVFPLLFHHALA